MGTSFETGTLSTDGGGSLGIPVGTAIRKESRPRRATAEPSPRLADEARGTGGE